MAKKTPVTVEDYLNKVRDERKDRMKGFLKSKVKPPKVVYEVSEAKKRGKDFKAVGNREFIMLEENSLRLLKAEIRIKFKFTGPMTVKKTLKGPNITTDAELQLCKKLIYVYHHAEQSNPLTPSTILRSVSIADHSQSIPPTRSAMPWHTRSVLPPRSTSTPRSAFPTTSVLPPRSTSAPRSVFPTTSVLPPRSTSAPRSVFPTKSVLPPRSTSTTRSLLPDLASSPMTRPIKPEEVIKIGVDKHELEQNVLLLSQFKISEPSAWQRIGFINITQIVFEKQFEAEGTFKKVYKFEAKSAVLNGSYVLKFFKDDESVINCIENVCQSGVTEMTLKAVKVGALTKHWVQRFNQSIPAACKMPFTLSTIDTYLVQAITDPIPIIKIDDKTLSYSPGMIEKYMPGVLVKTINNNGQIINPDSEESKFTECFSHFIYNQETASKAIPLDIQFFRQGKVLQLTDVEIATHGKSQTWEFRSSLLEIWVPLQLTTSSNNMYEINTAYPLD